MHRIVPFVVLAAAPRHARARDSRKLVNPPKARSPLAAPSARSCRPKTPWTTRSTSKGSSSFSSIAACRRALRRRLDRLRASRAKTRTRCGRSASAPICSTTGNMAPGIRTSEAGFGAHLLQEKDNGHDIGDGESKFGGSRAGRRRVFLHARHRDLRRSFATSSSRTFADSSPSGVLLAAGREEILLGRRAHRGARYAFTFLFSSLRAMACGCFA